MASHISINELVQTVGQLNTNEFEEFFLKIQSLHAQKIASEHITEEKKLVKQIKTSLSPSKQNRFEYLIACRDAHSISEKEFEELLKLTEEVEKNDLIRLKRIAKLADLKQLSLSEVVRMYDLQPTQNGQ